MELAKAPESVVEAFGQALPDDSRIERRKMFGYPSAFTGGNMFAGVHGASLIVRLAKDDRGELLGVEGAKVFEPIAGRLMREYVVIPPKVADDPAELRDWVDRAFQYAASLPPKEKKEKGPAKARKKNSRS